MISINHTYENEHPLYWLKILIA